MDFHFTTSKFVCQWIFPHFSEVFRLGFFVFIPVKSSRSGNLLLLGCDSSSSVKRTELLRFQFLLCVLQRKAAGIPSGGIIFLFYSDE
jgi:hypothetical protein